MPSLDISPLEKAVAALERATDTLAEFPPSHPHYEHFRNSAVQGFEVLQELCLAFMRRHAAATRGDKKPLRDARDILRVAQENGLIADAKRWMAHRKLRNITSHTYDEDKADRAAEGAVAFLADAKDFTARLRARLDEEEEES